MTRRALALALFLAVALALFWRLGERPPHHRGEERSDAIARELVESGHWLFPTLNGAARLQKPPLFYWAAAATSELAGGPSAFTLRCPSALAGLATLALVLVWGSRALGSAAGLASAAALAAMGQLWLSARLGTADMLLVFFTTASLAAFERLWVTRDARWLPALAVLFTAAFLAKATAALVDVGVPVAAWLAAERRLDLALRPRALAWAGAAACASVAWYAAALLAVPDAGAHLREFFFVPLGAGHSDLASDHYRPVWWYVPRFFSAALPAVLLLPLVVRDGARSRWWRETPTLRFAAVCLVSLFLAWSLIPQKGRHYLLPMLPPFALLVGSSLARLPEVVLRRATLVTALFAVMAAGLWLAPQRGSPPSSEDRCVGVVESMVATGNWLVPYFEGEPRLQKPPLYYWAGAAVVELTHQPVVVALRDLSSLVSLALAAAVFAYGWSLGGFALGLASAAAVGASFLFYQRGRVGDAEPLLALLTFLALAAFETSWRTRDRRWLPALAVTVGLAFLTKATASLLDVFVPILAWLAFHRSLGLALRPRVLAWAALALAISLSWYVAILVHVPDSLELFRQYLIGPLGVHAGGRDAIHSRELWYYVRFPLLTAPVGLLLPWIAWQARKTRGFSDDAVSRFLALALVTLFAAWSLVPSKQMHYLLPLVPLQALLVARLCVAWWRRRSPDDRVGTLPTL